MYIKSQRNFRLNTILRIPKKFSFQPVSTDEVKKIIKNLKNSKSLGEKFQQKS